MQKLTQKNLLGIQCISSVQNAKIEAGCNRCNCSDFAAHLLLLHTEEGKNNATYAL